MCKNKFIKKIMLSVISAMFSLSVVSCSFDLSNLSSISLDSDTATETVYEKVKDIDILPVITDVSNENLPDDDTTADDEETAEVVEEIIEEPETPPEPEEFFVCIGDPETTKYKEISSNDYYANISGIPITDLDSFKLEIAKLPHLVYLDMCNCGLTNEQMEELIDEFPMTKFVWMISMTSTNEARTLVWKCRTDALAFSTLHGYATDPRMTNPDGQQLKYCKDLVALDLGHNAVYDIEFLKDNPNIHILIMVDAYNRDRHCKFDDLSILENEPNLMYLEFFVGGITDLSFLQYNKEMVDLNISYNPISDSTYLYDLPKIERLYMESTYIPYSEFEKLKEVYPDAQLEYYGSGSIDHGWRSHPRYFAMIDMYRNNYWNDLFRTEEELADAATYDLLQLGKKRYWGTSTIAPAPTVEEIAGYIQDTLPHDQLPADNQQCNFDGFGHPYSTDDGTGAIRVYMSDGQYHWFYSNEVLARRLRYMKDEGGLDEFLNK